MASSTELLALAEMFERQGFPVEGGGVQDTREFRLTGSEREAIASALRTAAAMPARERDVQHAAQMDDRALILAAMSYRSGNDSCNSFYMGSMATANLYHALGIRYGGDVAFKDALMAANDATVAKVKKAAQRYIDYMLDHPVKHCPTCGQIAGTA